MIFLIFCIILFLYIHICFNIKTSNDLEIFNIEIPNKEKFEEICNLKQPIQFYFNNKELNKMCSLTNIKNNFSIFDVNIRNLKEKNDNKPLYSSLTLKKALKVLEKDEDKKYLIESNDNFINETGLIRHFINNDLLLKPYLNFTSLYDIVIGNKNIITSLKYDLFNRNFLYIVKGSTKIKLIPPKYTSYLHEIKDYENNEFFSPINCWNLQKEYKNDFNKLKYLELTLNEGDMLFIPAYWWYSLNFNEYSLIARFKYTTYMSYLSTLPFNLLHYLQLQNIKYNVLR